MFPLSVTVIQSWWAVTLFLVSQGSLPSCYLTYKWVQWVSRCVTVEYLCGYLSRGIGIKIRRTFFFFPQKGLLEKPGDLGWYLFFSLRRVCLLHKVDNSYYLQDLCPCWGTEKVQFWRWLICFRVAIMCLNSRVFLASNKFLNKPRAARSVEFTSVTEQCGCTLRPTTQCAFLLPDSCWLGFPNVEIIPYTHHMQNQTPSGYSIPLWVTAV